MFLRSNKLSKIILAIVMSSFLGACATTQKGKVFEYSLIGGMIGAAFGNSRPEYKTQNSMLYSSQGALLGGALAVALDDSDQKIKELESKVKFLDETPKATPLTDNLKLELPEEFRPLLESQTYEVYRINRWTRKGPKYLVKESEVIEIK